MSKIGKQHIAISDGVQVLLNRPDLTIKGPKGELSIKMFDSINLEVKDGKIVLAPKQADKKERAVWGLARALINNMVTGVVTGFTKKLEINGVGYRAAVDGDLLILTLGYSHEIIYPIPQKVQIECPKNTLITVTGCDKQLVGQVCADIRSLRKPEPYKGKGIKYENEVIIRKEGKKK
ncbi:50S ribosomal protein L6 [Candidatus Bandiella euplotis]|uniref:Large ribosomal subunit protein uL6 n=1 Tax=Candidatus Bandiella euplotis TaxID=1664265 RepID=A0ABZ0UMM2_9RICK|nr:50S ribosomal protein L6 [Candidatus Bandiella woodruffii]WPX96767.1 50S ribosomal protein L6 [Candidatus Bandiella woodruffii]